MHEKYVSSIRVIFNSTLLNVQIRADVEKRERLCVHIHFACFIENPSDTFRTFSLHCSYFEHHVSLIIDRKMQPAPSKDGVCQIKP